jgi:hypothetical protein
LTSVEGTRFLLRDELLLLSSLKKPAGKNKEVWRKEERDA